VDATNLNCAKTAEGPKGIFVKEAESFLKAPKGSFQQPTAEEVFRQTFEKSRLNVCAQEARNHFANLLNRGSWLE
jgi:hypothetical protein